MILQSLKHFDEHTATGILAGLALASTPNPGVGSAAKFETGIGERELEVLAEIRSKLKISDEDVSPSANAQILEVVSNALSETALKGKDRREIVARAGNRGLLPPAMYRIEVVQGFSHNFAQFGARESHARQTILEADDYQHLINADVRQEPDKFSLFLKWHPGNDREDGYWALVFTFRDGGTLKVQHLWRVYSSDVDMGKAKTPVEVLKAFCEKFGSDVTVGKKTAKFIAQERFPAKVGSGVAEASWSVAGSPNAQNITTASIRKYPENPFMDVGIVYAIDIAKYKTSLRRHGVMVS